METRVHGYLKEELTEMNIDSLRAMLHERTHHGIEVLLYRILKGKLKKPEKLGFQAKILLDIWRDRGFPLDTPDIKWCKKYIEIADKLNAGESIELEEVLPKPFTEYEMSVVRKLLYERRSIRQFKDEPIPDWMIKEVIYAGLMSPQGCNVDSRRFLVLKEPDEWKLVISDIPIENCVMIVVCQDMRIYKTLRFDQYVPQNIYYDAAAAADHICLMAHALGLGACWLTHGEETQKRLREYLGMHEDFVSRNHIVIGWPDETPIKSQRMSLDDAIIART